METYFFYTTICDTTQEAFTETESTSYWYWLVTTGCVFVLVYVIIMIASYFKPPAKEPVQLDSETLEGIKKPVQQQDQERETVIEKMEK